MTNFRQVHARTPRRTTYEDECFMGLRGALRTGQKSQHHHRLRAVEGTFVATSPLGRLVLAHREAVLAISARYHASNVRVFGSVVRGTETPESDIDFLVDFDENAHPLDILALGCNLEEELGVKVDVCTPRGLRSFVKDEIFAEAVSL